MPLYNLTFIEYSSFSYCYIYWKSSRSVKSIHSFVTDRKYYLMDSYILSRSFHYNNQNNVFLE